MTARTLLLAALAAFSVGCGDEDSATAPTDTEQVFTSVTYTGTLDAGAARFYSFTNNASGSVTAFLASVTSVDSKQPVALPLEIGIGIPAGTGCATTTTQLVTPGLATQLSASLAAGVYCVRVADAGEIKAPITFAVRFVHP